MAADAEGALRRLAAGFFGFGAALAAGAGFRVAATFRAAGFFASFFSEGDALDFFTALAGLPASFFALAGALREMEGRVFAESACVPGPEGAFDVGTEARAGLSGRAAGFSIEFMEGVFFTAAGLDAGAGFAGAVFFALTNFFPTGAGF